MDRDRNRRTRPASPVPGAVLSLVEASLREAATATAARTWEATPADRPRRSARGGPFSVTGRSVTINRPRPEVYAFSRNFTDLSRFMENVVRVEGRDGMTSWTVRAPGGRMLRLRTVIVEDRPGEQIAWRSVEGSDVRTEGRIMLRDASDGRGTVLTAIVAWVPPSVEPGQRLAGGWRRKTAARTRRELDRLRMLLEMGDPAAARPAET